MWQSLLRSWLMHKAQDELLRAAAQPQESSGPPSECDIGLLFALTIEAGGLVDRLANAVRREGHGLVAWQGTLAERRIVAMCSGAGQPAAARAAEAMIHAHRPKRMIVSGFAGGLDPGAARGDLVMADELVDESGRRLALDLHVDRAALAAVPGVRVGRLLTVDRIIASPAEKRALGVKHQALAVDMESFAAAEVCRRGKTPLLAVRIISDGVDDRLPPEVENLVRQRSLPGRLGAVAGALVRRPASAKDMWRLKEQAIEASERLAKFLTGIVEQM
jgi:adenosylhomocysteine nucleosidase